MGENYSVTDPRGYVVRFSGEYFNAHIVSKRPQMQGCEDRVLEAIKNPRSFIFGDKEDDSRHIYYGSIKPFKKWMYLRVVVKYNDNNEGILITAYPTKNMTAGERIIWPKLTP